MSTYQIHVFISHSWAYSGHYDTLEDWIFKKKWRQGQASLNLRDYSVPRDSPIHDAPTDRALREAIYDQILICHVIVIPLGMYANYSKWIQKEIDGAKNYAKPILGVRRADLLLWSAQQRRQLAGTAKVLLAVYGDYTAA